ncbi:hypothetical protein ACFV1N_04915 [Streptosporangium canum]|uniref:phage tail protein n=1 Tax=Streptosporangium canum TaxID=324952 RepID=UPI0036BCC8A3
MATLKTLLVKLGMDTKQFKSGVNRALTGLDSMVARAEKLNGVARAGGMAVLAGQAIQLSGALAPAAGALAALPAAMLAAKVASVTLKVGLAGVGDAMSAVADGDAKKLAEAMEKLSPNARAFVLEAKKFAGALSPIRTAVQDKLFDGLAGSLGKTAKSLLPTITTGMTELSGVMNKVAKEALKTASTPLFKGQLAQVFSGTTGVVKTLSAALQPLITMVMELGIAGMPLVQRMAEWAVHGAEVAAAFLKSKDGAAKMQSIIKGAGDTLATLGSIVKNVGVGLAGIFKGANSDGGNLLGTIEQLTARFAAWSQSAQGQQQIAQIFSLLGQTASALGPVLGILVGPLTTIAGLITSMPPGVQGVVTQLLAFAIVAGTIGAKLGPAISGIRLLVTGIGGIPAAAGKIGSAATAVAGFAGKVVTGTATAAAAAGRMAISVGAAAGRAAMSMAVAAASFLASAAQMVASMVVTAARVVAGWVLMGAQSLAQAARVAAAWVIAMGPIGWIIAAVIALVALIVANWDTIKEAIGAAWEWVQEKTVGVWNAITGALSAAWEGIKSAAAATWEWIKAKVKAFVDGAIAIFQNFTLPGLIMKHWETIKSAAAAAWDWVVSKVEGAAKGIIAGVSWLAELPGKVKQWFAELVQGAVNKAAELLTWAKELGGKILSGLGKLGSLLLSAGKDLVMGLINGVKNMASQAVEAVKGVVDNAVQAAKNLLGIASPSKVFAEIGKWSVQGLIQGLTAEEGKVKDTIAKMVETIKKAFASKPDVAEGLLEFVRTGNKNLEDLALQREALVKRLADAKEYAKQVAGSAQEWAAITGLGLEEGAGAGDVASGLKNRAQAIKDFATNIQQLAKRGLNKTTLKQIIDAGVEQGGSLAEMLVGADGSEIKAINRAQAQIDKMSKQLGKSGADALFDVGQKAGAGYLKGLQESLKKLDAEMEKIVDALVTAIKKKLKIKSPSQVMADIGVHTIAGLIQGMQAMEERAVSAISSIAGKTVASAAKASSVGAVEKIAVNGAASTGGNGGKFTGPLYRSAAAAGAQPGVTVNMHDTVIREEADITKVGAQMGFEYSLRGNV